ncbi:guanine nucleotide exchange protein for ADP-robosylation factor, partial [Spiromyces aspiralis]
EDLADMLESIFALTNNPGARSPPPALHPAQDNDSAPRRREASICGSNVNSANSLFESTGTVSRYRRWQSRKPQQQLLLQQQPRSHYSIDEGSRYRRPNTNLFSFGLRMFNLKPRVGIEQWQSDGFLKSSPLSPLEVAYFLFVNVSSGIDKKQLGEYLGSDEPFNVEVLHRFVQLMDFTAIEFVAALRKFLQVFRLPGEAQKIDRIMMAFARRYSDNNPKMFASSDTAHVLAYSVIMLNTDLHSAQIKRRMTKQEFIDNNQGINNEEDLPREMLEDIYDEIAANEIILVDDHRC